MSTGDVNKNVQRTVDHLTLVNYPRAVSARRLAIGDPTEILPILHHVLLDFSPFVAAFVATAGFTLFSKDDASFTDDVFRLATKHFGLNPGLQARHFLSQGFVERKLIFVVDLMRACKSLHDEGRRNAAADAQRPVHPYVSHHSLEPASASTRWDLRIHNRVEVLPDSNAAALQSARANSLPSASTAERPSSDFIYSGGVSAARLEAADVEAQALQFLSDAVALGSGAGASLVSRRKQALFDQNTSAPALLAAVSGHLTDSAGWQARAAADAAHIAAGGSVYGLSNGRAPPPAASRLPVHRRYSPQGAIRSVGMHTNSGTGPLREWPVPARTSPPSSSAETRHSDGEVAALNSSVADPANITRAERELGSSSTFLNIGERASAQAAPPTSIKNEDDPAKQETTTADMSAIISARNSAAAQLRAATATVISAQLVSGIERTSAQLMGSLSQLENRLRSLEEHEQELSSRSRAAVANLVKEGNMAAASLDSIADGARASAPLSSIASYSSTLGSALRSTGAKPSLASHPYALLPSSTINRLHSTASQLASGGSSTEAATATSDPEACARQAMISNRDLARRTLVTEGFDAASGLLADAAIAAASSKMPKARTPFDDEDDDDAFQAALSRARERVHPSQAIGPDSSASSGVVDDGLSSFLQDIASRFAETDATIARNKSILRA